MSVQPGWYDDGVTPGVVRWFDGQQWTTRTAAIPVAPIPAAPAVTAPVAPTPAAPTPAASTSAPFTAMWTPQPLAGVEPVATSVRSGHAAGTGHATTGYAPAPGYPPATGFVPVAGYVPPRDDTRSGYAQSAYAPVGLGDAGRAERRRAIGLLLGGLAVLLAAALSLKYVSENGGAIRAGVFVLGLGLLIRAGVAGRASRDNGGSGLGWLAWTGAGAVVLVCAGLVVTSLTTIFEPGPPTETVVGSCFVDRGAEVELVRCDDEHDLVALALVPALDECPSATTAYVEDAGRTVCLGPDAATVTS